MEPLIITKASGAQLKLQQKNSLVTIVEGSQNRTLVGEDTVTLAVESVRPIDFTIGDKLPVFGEVYTLNRLPTATKTAAHRFAYDLTLEGPQYSLRRLIYFNQDVAGVATGSDFSLTGDLTLFAQVLMHNIHRAFPDWTLGAVQAGTPTKTLTFSGANCLLVMQRLCTEFNTEFELVRAASGSYMLHFRKVGEVLNQTFQYGKAKGLYSLSRQTVSDKDFITRLYAYGSTKNIPTSYRDGADRLRLATAGSYLESAAARAAFDLIEGTKVFEDIYPKRTGTITSVGPTGLTFTDPGMDFDLTEVSGPPLIVNGKSTPQYRYLVGGVAAKVQVQSGSLSGYGFEINAYNHATKTFTISPFKDERELTLPGAAPFVLKPGDTYVLLDIIMPQSYVDAAELKLKEEAQAYLDANSAPYVQYSLDIAETYLRGRDTAGSVTNFFAPGDYVQIKDDDLNIDKASRVLSFSRDLLRPYKYGLTIADSYQVSLIERMLADQQEVKTIVKVNNLYDSKRLLYGWKAGQELLGLVFDTDGQFDGSKIKALSIEAGSLAIGAKSQQLVLNIVIEPNLNGQANSVKVNAGSLTHYTIDETGIRTWFIGSQVSAIGDNQARYIYAKCNRNNFNDALLSFDTVQRRFDSDSTYWYFLIGVLHAVATGDGARLVSLTYGATTINGRFIRTGRIQSADGLTYFDLDTGEIGGNIIFQGNEGGGDTSLSTLEAEVVYLRNVTLPNLKKSLLGKLVSYFQNSDPNTWATADRPNHDGEMWYRLTDKKLFVYKASDNSWTENNDKTAIAAFEAASRAESAADGKSTSFIVQPFAPYDIGDLWSDGAELRRCIVAKQAGQPFNANDWSKATSYDNTTTAINGGIVTSGTVQLAGDGGAVEAGITGVGNVPESVRIWAGASYVNRMFAPFRVLQSGEVFARKRIEMQNENSIGQAGMAGANSAADGLVRFWAGATYSLRNDAPFRVLADGTVITTKGSIGKLTLVDGALIAQDANALVQLDINKPDPNSPSDWVNIRSVTATSDDTVLKNIALYLDAVNNTPLNTGQTVGRPAYAIYAIRGKSMLAEGLFNGRAHRHFYSLTNRTIDFDPRLVDSVSCYAPSGTILFTMITRAFGSGVLKEGKEITFVNLHPVNGECYIRNEIRANEENVKINVGEVLTIVYYFGNWLVKSRFQNAYTAGQLTNIPLTDQ